MNSVTRLAALNKFRSTSSAVLRQPTAKILVIYDVQLKNNEAPHVPLVVNYGASHKPNHELRIHFLLDLPKAVEEYSHR